jgi:hypothetical protein
LRKKINLLKFNDFNELFPKTPQFGGNPPSPPSKNQQ